jgi:hypothetical protein
MRNAKSDQQTSKNLSNRARLVEYAYRGKTCIREYVAVYVDKLVDYGWRHGPSCHLIADSVDELIEFAESMGMRREWYQPLSSPHFDLTADGRALAVEKGAIELDNRQLVAKLRELRALRKAGASV